MADLVFFSHLCPRDCKANHVTQFEEHEESFSEYDVVGVCMRGFVREREGAVPRRSSYCQCVPFCLRRGSFHQGSP